MGCDIHGVVERRVGGKWVAVKILGLLHMGRHHDYGVAVDAARVRNYRRFAALAGVRGDGPAANGVPTDVSDTAALMIASDGREGHHHSWLPLAEATSIFAATEPWPDAIRENDWPRCSPADLFFGVDSDDIDEHRLVFWFDN